MRSTFVKPTEDESLTPGQEWYKKYLQSWWWRKLVRPRALRRDGYKCRLCPSTERLEIHHRDYTWCASWQFWREVSDLTTLCHKHHSKHHHD